MTISQRLASRKLVVAALSIAAVTLNRKWGIGLTPEEIQAITDITLAAIGSQAGIDLAERTLPLLIRSRAETARRNGDVP
ncbi:MAG: hypothetical protein AB9872_11605 [Solidesulfovibrio sp.]